MHFTYETESRLAYAAPSQEENEKAYELLRTICLEEIKKRFPCSEDTGNRVLFELNCYRLNKRVVELLILREIAAFSRGNGYPVMLPGMENKLVLFELLGITDVCPTEMDYIPPRDDMALAHLSGAETSFEIHVAAHIRHQLPDRLNDVFGPIGSTEGRGSHIIIQPFEALDCIGELAARTGVPYETIDIASLHAMCDPELLNALATDVIEQEFGWQPDAVHCYRLDDVARLYAFARCNAAEKTPQTYRQLEPYIFRDDVYGRLVTLGFPTQIAFRLARNWAKGDEKERDMEMMRRRGAFPALLANYKRLQNQWTESSCLAHVTVLAILKYYELRYPDVYAQIRAKYDAQETE